MKGKITFNKSGRLTIPVAFLEVLKITEEDRDVEISFENRFVKF